MSVCGISARLSYIPLSNGNAGLRLPGTAADLELFGTIPYDILVWKMILLYTPNITLLQVKKIVW